MKIPFVIPQFPRVSFLFSIPVIFSLCLLLIPLQCFSEEFVREHTYHAGDDDSKNDSRRNALEQIQLELLAEVGVYVQSEWELRENEEERIVSEEIEAITAGITETEILHESWDGFLYRIEAKMEVDIKDARKRLNQVIKERKKRKKLSDKIYQKDKELRSRYQEIVALKAELVKARKKNPKKKEKKAPVVYWTKKKKYVNPCPDSRTWWERTVDNMNYTDRRPARERYCGML
tara:strand:- start:2244 stop:2942 length:699 start_codon:yes stop_codon:yes gene_type:complete